MSSDPLAPGVRGDRGAAREVGERRVERARARGARGRASRTPAAASRAARRVSRSSAAADASSRSAPARRPPRETPASARAGARGQLEHGVADRARVVAGVAAVRLGLAEVAGEQRGQREREPQADAVGRRLRRQVAERDVQPPARVLVAAEPPLLVGERDGEREPLARAGAVRSASSSVARAAGGSPAAACASASRPAARVALGRPAVGQQPQRGGVEARGGRGRRRLQLARGRGEQRDRRLVARAARRARRGARARPARRRAARARPPRGRARRAASRPALRHVDRVADDRVAEREARAARRPAARARRASSSSSASQRRGLGELGDRGGEVGLERVAGDGGAVEQAARAGRERGELGGERGGDRGRDPLGHGRAAAVCAGHAAGRPAAGRAGRAAGRAAAGAPVAPPARRAASCSR